ANVSTTVNAVADLALTKTGTPNPAGVGVNLTYTLTASNNGPSPATGVTLTDRLPAGVTFVSVTSSQGSCTGAATITCNLGTMATGVNAAVSIVVTPTTVGTITNTAIVNSSVSDPNPENNTATSTVTVVNSPTLTLSANSLNFASQPVGSSSSAQIVTLTNGSAALPLNFVGIVASGDFSQTNNCGSSLASSASCNILVTFTPSAAGTRTGAITITDNAVGSPQGVSLTGIGINSPAITLSPVSLIFSSRLVGTSSPPLTISMSNTGNATLNISSIAITGTNGGDFTQGNNCGATLAPTASCTISVVFTPTAGGQRTAGVAITSDARGSVPVVTLSGTGLSPGIDLSTGLLIFDNETVGTTSSPQTVTVSNAGATAVTISSIAATGDFAQTNTCGNSIAASTNCAIHVTFTPTATGTRTGSLTIMSSDTGSPHMVSLTGTGVVVTLSLSPTSLTFQDQTVGTSSQPQTIKLSNTGGAILTISSIVPSGDFLETNNCGASLAAGTACTISVSFLPTTTGTRNGALTVNSNAQGSPQSATLTGNGVLSGPAVSLSCMSITPCNSLSFPAQAVGTTSAAQKVTLTNTGNAVLNISSITASGDFAAQSDCGPTLAANAFCTISITFTPVTTGTTGGGVKITDNTGDSPQQIILIGTGTPSGPAASLSTTSVAFPDQAVGTTSAAKIVTLANTGNAALTINSIKPSGDFGETTTCGNSLAPSDTCSISITFSPATSGARAGAVTISDNAAGNPQAITLSGNGTDFSFSLPPGSPNSGTIAAGQTLTFTSVVAPLGGFNGTVTVSCSGAPPAGTCSSNPSTFNLNATTTITTTVTTTAPSSASAMPGLRYAPPTNVPLTALWQLLGVLVSVLVFLVAVTRRRRAWAAAAACMCLALFMSSCAGGSSSPGIVAPSPGTPPGNYTIILSVSTANGAPHILSLTVTVHP
ncbi:MAG TPA: choice-of-anchor D domain-containing protein, partial [Terriglobales bacterium]|nr:choice-of-anchor D domain-containing protein [Terriglobales bacterium]